MKTLIFLLSLFYTASVFAQKNKLDIGITAGPSANYLYGYERFAPGTYKPLIAFSAGVTIQYNLPKTFSLISGILYEKKGERLGGYLIEPNGQQGAFEQKYIYNYITVPVLARFNFGKKVLFFVEGGGFASYLLSAYTYFDWFPVNYYVTNTTTFYKQINAGASLGLGVSAPLGEKLILTAAIRDNLGLTNLSKFPVYKDKALKTNSANLLVGLAYRLGKRSA